MGWKEGKGLGKHETGMASAVKVKKRLDGRGLGADQDHTGNNAWAVQAQSFDGLLSTLNAKYTTLRKDPTKDKKIPRRTADGINQLTDGEGLSGEPGQDKELPKAKRIKKENSKSPASRERMRRKADVKLKKGREKGNSKSRQSPRDGYSAAGTVLGERIEAKTVDAKRKQRLSKRTTRHRLGRSRFIESKNLRAYSARDMAAVLGVSRELQGGPS